MDSKIREILNAKRQQDHRSSCDEAKPSTSHDASATLDVNSADDIRQTAKSLVQKPTNSEESIETDTQNEIETQNAKISAKNKKNDTFDTVRITMQLIDEEGNKKKVEPTKTKEEQKPNDDKKVKKQTPKAKERVKKRRLPRKKSAVPKKRIRYNKTTSRRPRGIRLYRKKRERVFDSASDSDVASISSPSSETDSVTD